MASLWQPSCRIHLFGSVALICSRFGWCVAMAVQSCPDFDQMPKKDLMVYARTEFQIPTRVRSNKGKLNAYRPVQDVREDCKREVTKRMLSVSSMDVVRTPGKRRLSPGAKESEMESPVKYRRNSRRGLAKLDGPKHRCTIQVENSQDFSPSVLHRDSLMKFARSELGVEVREKSSSGKKKTNIDLSQKYGPILRECCVVAPLWFHTTRVVWTLLESQ